MSVNTAIVVGFLLGLLLSACIMLTTLMHYVSSDMEGFRRWLDKGTLS